ncbi:pyridoxamine 5'-phosphate oxidase family protein [Amycolatopsis nigrescens]|uniref:pyridoxamine 5'-phosphate oxidase family protein n=1 Tax=Amycolatopsis nigrescens TaxID=381445 RepID=UPI000366121C|nr:pyridoxamine 5'-phosphate oxidase family protein [Amycolatopsis nigrescens]
MSRKMNPEQRESFLAEPYVGVLSVASETGRAPLTTPIWYDYRPGGDVKVLTSPGLRKTRLITDAGRFALCVQATDGPYRYVTVEGPVLETRPVTEEERYEMAARYLGPELAAGYVKATHAAQSGNIAFRMRPERWNTADFSDLADKLG